MEQQESDGGPPQGKRGGGRGHSDQMNRIQIIPKQPENPQENPAKILEAPIEGIKRNWWTGGEYKSCNLFEFDYLGHASRGWYKSNVAIVKSKSVHK